MSLVSATHLVLIPSYNAGPKLFETVRDARRAWTPVWVVVDGSTDESLAVLGRMSAADPGTDGDVARREQRQGRGRAPRDRSRAGPRLHACPHDGRRRSAPPASFIALMEASMRQPEAVILGKPVFDETAPAIRLRGRRIANWWTDRETGKGTIGDSLFGSRVYPIAGLDRGHAREPLDATVRFRSRSRREARVARPSRRQHPGPLPLLRSRSRAACRISTTCATMCCSWRCTSASSWPRSAAA